MKVDITIISTDELEKDLQDSRNDISTCEIALLQGIKTYSGGLVEDRLKMNKHFVEVITKELDRRSEIKQELKLKSISCVNI